MTDLELLELAAKASDIPENWIVDGKTWNPLANDGDALRLAVRLGLTMRVKHKTKATHIGSHAEAQLGEPHRDDPYAATRRAIVRAAAVIGRSAP